MSPCLAGLWLLVGLSLVGSKVPDVHTLCDLGVCSCPLGGLKIVCDCDNKLQGPKMKCLRRKYSPPRPTELVKTGYQQEILLLEKGIPRTVGSITVKNCLKVRVASRSIRNIRPLRSVSLVNISQLDLEEGALSWEPFGTYHTTEPPYQPGIELEISRSNISFVPSYTFSGNINSIRLRDLSITEIRTLAFANLLKVDFIEIMNCHVGDIRPKAFSKFIVNTLTIEGGNINLMPSYSMNSIEVLNKLRIENVHIKMIHSSAFRLSEPKSFALRSCKLGVVEGEAFLISTKGPVFIDDNVMGNVHEGAFVRIHLDPRTHPYLGSQEFVFENNTLMDFDNYALTFNTTGMKMDLDRIIIKKLCSCTEAKNWSNKLVKYLPKRDNFSVGKVIWCQKDAKFDTILYDFEQKHCHNNSWKVNWIFAVPVVGLLLLLGICSAGFYFYKKRLASYMGVPTNNNKHDVFIVLPKMKTYEEQEFNMPIERAEPMKEFSPRA